MKHIRSGKVGGVRTYLDELETLSLGGTLEVPPVVAGGILIMMLLPFRVLAVILTLDLGFFFLLKKLNRLNIDSYNVECYLLMSGESTLLRGSLDVLRRLHLWCCQDTL